MISREEARQRGRDYINSEAGEAAAEALGALLEALEKAREANDDDACKDAHEQALAARADLEFAIGVRAWRRQRIVSTAAGLPPHRRAATAKGIESIFRRGGRDTEQRFAISRILMDELGGILGGRPENLEAATLFLAEKGYHGPQANPGKDSASGRQPYAKARTPMTGLPKRGAGASIPRSVTRSARKGSATAIPPIGNGAPCCISGSSAQGSGQGLSRRSSRPSRLAWWRLSASWPLHGPTLRTSRKTVILTTRANSSPANCFGPAGGRATPPAVRIALISH